MPGMKLFVAIGVICLILAAPLGLVAGYNAYKINQDLSELDLADDASTPQQKSEFLGTFMQRMEQRRLPEHAAWFFPTPRDKVSNQMAVLKSLKQRCDELAKVDPSSLGYAQGMQQISGQEFDHATTAIASIFDKAMSVDVGWFMLYGWLIFAIPGVAIIGLSILVAMDS